MDKSSAFQKATADWLKIRFIGREYAAYLLQYHHPSCRCKFICCQRVEIEPTGDSLTELVTSVPIGSTASILIHPRCLLAYS